MRKLGERDFQLDGGRGEEFGEFHRKLGHVE
jgi:hypothetical protein